MVGGGGRERQRTVAATFPFFLFVVSFQEADQCASCLTEVGKECMALLRGGSGGVSDHTAAGVGVLVNDDRDAAEQAAAFLIGDLWDLSKDNLR